MISIIISSYKEHYYRQVQQSIHETVGVPYEIIKIDNPGLYSIAQAYNMGAVKAEFDILCFIHEDIIFNTENWGKNIINHFQDIPELGVIGVAGAIIKTALPTSWGSGNFDDNKMNFIQHFKESDPRECTTYKGNNIEFVKVIDGVFIATKKRIWEQNKFDESIKGFHLYDIDFSLRISLKFKVAVVFDVLIEHFSTGNYDDNWIDATIKYHKDKNKSYLFDKNIYPLNKARHYFFLIESGKLSFKYRLKYVQNLGVDSCSSFIAVCLFLSAAPGKYLYIGYVNLKLRLKRIRLVSNLYYSLKPLLSK